MILNILFLLYIFIFHIKNYFLLNIVYDVLFTFNNELIFIYMFLIVYLYIKILFILKYLLLNLLAKINYLFIEYIFFVLMIY